MAKPNRPLMGTKIGATLALLPQLASAQANQPPAPGAFTRPDEPDRPATPDTGQDHTRAVEQLSQAVQRLREKILAVAQQPPSGRRGQAS